MCPSPRKGDGHIGYTQSNLELRPDAWNRAQVEAWLAALEAQLGGE